jgi:hypothetical protein
MIYPTEDDNLGIKEWEVYSIDRSITLEAEMGELNILIVRIELLGL